MHLQIIKEVICNHICSAQLSYYKYIWEAEINSNLPCSLEPDNHRLLCCGDPSCLEAASTASLAALIVAEGSVSDIMDLLDLAGF